MALKSAHTKKDLSQTIRIGDSHCTEGGIEAGDKHVPLCAKLVQSGYNDVGNDIAIGVRKAITIAPILHNSNTLVHVV